MLVLSRKKNESIVINNDIVVTVVEIRGDKVRLGIVAPKEVPVHRQEVFDAIHGKETPERTRRGPSDRQQAGRLNRRRSPSAVSGRLRRPMGRPSAGATPAARLYSPSMPYLRILASSVSR